MITLKLGDCLEVMKEIPDKSVDMVLCDPPYGTTACKWDSVIPFEPMWAQLNRIVKPSAAICLFGSEPFSSNLRVSNLKNFRYDWVWDKKFAGSFVRAAHMPLKRHEIVSVFYAQSGKYYPQMVLREKAITPGKRVNPRHFDKEAAQEIYREERKTYTHKFPDSYLYFPRTLGQKLEHPTQKPVDLLEYLIKTYTLENEIVLDFTMGSGSTGVAAKNLNRAFIGIERDPEYFEIAQKRIENAKPEVKEPDPQMEFEA